MRYFIWFWTRVIREAFAIVFRRRRETRRAYRLLDEIAVQFKGRFNPDIRRKVAVSYGIYLPMVCQPFARLAGRTISEVEKRRFILYFICSSVFDDFTDRGLLSEAELYALSFRYQQPPGQDFDQRVFKACHHQLREAVMDRAGYDDVSRRLYEAQQQSRAQYRSRLSREEIRKITFDKGGYAVQLCSFYLDQETDQAVRDCWYQLGALIQLTNDLYDIHKDLQDEIVTLPNTMMDAAAFEQFFNVEIAAMKDRISRLPYASHRKQDFSLSMAGIYAFGLIAIRQLKTIQNRAAHMPDMHKVKRRQLIIDMERPANLLRWFTYTYRYARLRGLDSVK